MIISLADPCTESTIGRCPTCHQVLPKRETPASWAKLLREMAKDCTDPALRAQALGRAAELEALSACACAARGGAPHAKGDPGCMYQPGTAAWARAQEPGP